MNSYSNYEDRIRELMERIAKDPSSRAFIDLGNIYLKLEMYAETIEIIKEGLKYAPDNQSALVVLGRAYRKKGNYNEATNIFNRVLSKDKQNLIALLALAEMKKKQGDYEESFRYYDSILFLDPGNVEAIKEIKKIKEKLDKIQKQRYIKFKEEEHESKKDDNEEVKKESAKENAEEMEVQHSHNIIDLDSDEQEEDTVEKKNVSEESVKQDEPPKEEIPENDAIEKEQEKEKEKEEEEEKGKEKGKEDISENMDIKEQSIIDEKDEEIKRRIIKDNVEKESKDKKAIEKEEKKLKKERKKYYHKNKIISFIEEMDLTNTDSKAANKKAEEQTIIEENRLKSKNIDPFLENKKTEKAPMPYELEGEDKFMFYSKEMARVYESQKQFKKALDIYKLLLRQNPDNEKLSAKVRNLNEKANQSELDDEAFKEKRENEEKSKAEFYDRINENLAPEPDENEISEFNEMEEKREEDKNISTKKQNTQSEKDNESKDQKNNDNKKDEDSKKNDNNESPKNSLAGFVNWMNKKKETNKDDGG